MKGPRADFAVIAGRIRPGAKVLDLGCGDGSLLRHLGIGTDWAPPEGSLVDRTLDHIRYPRVVMSVVVGAALAVSGAVMPKSRAVSITLSLPTSPSRRTAATLLEWAKASSSVRLSE